MRLGEQIKSITYLKTNTGEVMEKLAENHQPYIITQNGEARAVLMDVHDYDNQVETITLLKRLVMNAKEIENGDYQPFDNAIDRIRNKFRNQDE